MSAQPAPAAWQLWYAPVYGRTLLLPIGDKRLLMVRQGLHELVGIPYKMDKPCLGVYLGKVDQRKFMDATEGLLELEVQDDSCSGES